MCATRVTSQDSNMVDPYKETCASLPELFRGPAISRLNYRVYADIEQAYSALKLGEVDLVDYPVTQAGEDVPEISYDSCRDFGYYYVGFNCRTPHMRSKALRKAIAYLFGHVKRVVASRSDNDRLELMDGLLVQYYGRLVNPYVPSYMTEDLASAVASALEQIEQCTIDRDGLITEDGHRIERGAIRCLRSVDDPIAGELMSEFRKILAETGELASFFTFEDATRNEVAAQVYSSPSHDWHVFAGWQYVQDNLSRWNPGMSKLRLSLDWACDFQSDNSHTRNYLGFENSEYDKYAQGFLKSLYPRDIRGAVITEAHLDPRWNNDRFWQEEGGPIGDETNALPLLWKLQHLLAEECPLLPMFARTVRFARSAEVQDVWNGEPQQSFTYPGGVQPIESTYPGGTMSYWTFQRARKPDSDDLTIASSNRLRHLNPLGVGNYWDSVIWSRIYESLLGLNPFLLIKGVAEDNCNLAQSFRTVFMHGDALRQRLEFKLRPSIRWHDGTPFTADDVAFTFFSVLGGRGRLIAQRHESTAHLVDALVNEVPVPGWVDLLKWLHHVEQPDPATIVVYTTESSRFVHEWFGDVPIIPMHVWRHFGNDFTRPSYAGVSELPRIVDHDRGGPSDGFCGWQGMIGTGPFMWQVVPDRDPLTEGGELVRYEHYHHR